MRKPAAPARSGFQGKMPSAMNRRDLVAFIQRHQWGVVGVAVNDQLELVFDTLASTRKAQNLRRDPRVSVVIGWDDEQTVQYEGMADEPAGPELAEAQRHYFARFPDGPSRLAWPGIIYFRVRPTWIRFSDFRASAADEVGGALVIERSGAEWSGG